MHILNIYQYICSFLLIITYHYIIFFNIRYIEKLYTDWYRFINYYIDMEPLICYIKSYFICRYLLLCLKFHNQKNLHICRIILYSLFYNLCNTVDGSTPVLYIYKRKKLKKDIFKRNVYLFGCHSFFQKVSPFCFLPANYPRVLLELFHD